MTSTNTGHYSDFSLPRPFYGANIETQFIGLTEELALKTITNYSAMIIDHVR